MAPQRLRYIAPLDGIRAFAVLAVMAYHGGIGFMPGGFFGVDAFFVLSGYLITSLLLGEWRADRQISLPGFWARRARRLLPALGVMLLAVACYVRFAVPSGTYPELRLDSLSSLFYFANWHFIVGGENYFAATGPPSPLLHTWTLSIEEQFYVVWPIVVLVVVRLTRSLTPLFVLCIAGAVASATWAAAIFRPGVNETRVYFGTDTHAQCLLVGAGLAVGFAMWRSAAQTGTGRAEAELSPGARRALVALGLIGSAAVAVSWLRLGYPDPFVFRGGTTLVALAVGAVIASAVLVPTGPVGRALGLRPLRFLGTISYGMYLWHFPVDELAVTNARTGLNGWWLFAARTAVTIVLATASYYMIERPIRSGRLLGAARRWFTAPVAVGAATVAIVAATAVPAGALSDVSSRSGAATSATAAASTSSGGVRVLLVGDSVAYTLGASLLPFEREYHVNVVDETVFGCGVAIGKLKTDRGVVGNDGAFGGPCSTHPSNLKCPGLGGSVPCQAWPSAWKQWVQELTPNVVVFLGGRWETVDRTGNHGGWTNILHKRYANYIKQQLELAVTLGTSTGAEMVLETAPCFDSGEQPNGAPWPQDAPSRVATYNRLVREVGAEHTGSVVVQDLFAMVCPGGKITRTVDGTVVREADGVHFAPLTAGTFLAPRILPVWREQGQLQQASGGNVFTAPAPPVKDLAPA
ncbi:MAG TPA: acyltransferase family protein [Acidimicrobiales bacterium]|nr:acyltransferase family protein [Acidimicrobiales bacterium]